MKIILTSIAAIFLLGSFSEWRTRHDEDGIVVKIRSEGTNRDIWATVEVNASVEKCLEVLRDVNKLKIFTYRAKIVRLVGQPTANQWVVYAAYDLPALIRNHDAVTQYNVQRLANGNIEVNYHSVSHLVPVTRQFRRQDDFTGTWKFEEISPNRIRVTHTTTVTTEGYPGWLVNMVIANGPIFTMSNFRTEVEM